MTKTQELPHVSQDAMFQYDGILFVPPLSVIAGFFESVGPIFRA